MLSEGTLPATGDGYLRPRRLEVAVANNAVNISDAFNGFSSRIVPELVGGWLTTGPTFWNVATGSVSTSVWAYALGNAFNQNTHRRIDVGIFAKSHPVPLAPTHRHVALVIVPTNQQLWSPDFRFGQSNAFGKVYATIGAESTNGFCFGGLLNSIVDRPEDLDLTTTTAFEELLYRKIDEDELIQRLLELDEHYSDNLPYACTPLASSNSYNSNSYISGLLNRVGAISKPLLGPGVYGGQYPGWTKPVPPEHFGVEP